MRKLLEQVANFLFLVLFPNRVKQLSTLMKDNVELQSIVLEQIEYIKQLQDQVAELDYKLEDSEIKCEFLEGENEALRNELYDSSLTNSYERIEVEYED